MIRRQYSSNKLVALQIWLFFSSYTVSWTLLLTVNWIVYWLVPSNSKETSNSGSKLFQKLLFLLNLSFLFPRLRHQKLDKKHKVYISYDKIIPTICARWNI